MNYCRKISLNIRPGKMWVTYEQKTRTNEIPVHSWDEAIAIIGALEANVGEWLPEE